MELKNEAKKEIDRVEFIMKNLKLVKPEGNEILKLINSYFEDAKHFYEKERFLQAFEAAVICWAYVDAGLHLNVFEVPENLKKIFTV
jgi:hypothetical protein